MNKATEIRTELEKKVHGLFSKRPFSDVLDQLLAMDIDFYIVGGVVRDLALDREVKDLDLLMPKGGLRVARKLADDLGAAFYPLDEERGTGRVVFRSSELFVDVASMQGTLEQDLRSRDFTVNAVAVGLSSWPETEVVDIVNGLQHILDRRLSAVSEDSFRSDPVRVLRLVRFMAALGFRPDARTWTLATESVAGLAQISAERIRDEIVHIVETRRLTDSLSRLSDLGADAVVLPELDDLKGIPQPAPHFDDVYNHTLSVVEYTERHLRLVDGGKPGGEADSALVEELGEFFPKVQEHLSQELSWGRTVRCCLKLAAVAHDWGKPKTFSLEDGDIHFYRHESVGGELAQARLRALAFSRAEVDWVSKLVRLHMRIHDLAHSERITDRAIFRLVRDAGDTLPSLVLLNLADHRGTYQDRLDMGRWIERLRLVKRILDFFYHRLGARLPKPILSGKDVMQLWDIPPGPEVGRILRSLQEAQAVGEVSTREEAIEWVERFVSAGDEP